MSGDRIDERTGLPLGPIPAGEDSAGHVGITYRERDPRCRGQCTSRDRPAYSSPAKVGTERGTGRKVVWCPCCGHELFREPEPQGVTNERPANLNPGLTAGRHVRFTDRICNYDAVLLFDVKEA